MDLDLGDKPKAKITVNGQTVELSMPTVGQVEVFLDELKDNEGQEFKVFRSFVTTLGMPDEIGKDLTVSQFKRLADGLMGLDVKK